MSSEEIHIKGGSLNTAFWHWQPPTWRKKLAVSTGTSLALIIALTLKPAVALEQTQFWSVAVPSKCPRTLIQEVHKESINYTVLLVFLMILVVGSVAAYQVGHLRGAAITPEEIKTASRLWPFCSSKPQAILKEENSSVHLR